VWQSTDVGVTWTKVNDDYNGEGEHIKAGAVDSNDNIFIIEGDEDVWKSIDSGTGWTKVNDSDFNGGNGDAKGMTALLVGTDLTFQARSCELANCSDESFSGSYTNPSGENLSVSANRYFQYKASFSSDASDMTPKLYNVSIDYTVLSSEPSDSEAPAITLISPTNNTGDNDGDITLSYNITDDSDIANCSLIINDVINQTDSNVTKNMTQEFMLNNLTARIYMWGVNCTDSFGNEGSSETRQFSAILTTEFSGDTTDLSVTDVSNIANLIIENISAGKIVFQESVDLSSGANIDGNVSISFNSIEISTDTLPALNKSANVYVYSLDYIDPTPVLNSVECPSSICTEISYENGTFVFSVTQFSVYSTKETPINDDSSDSTSQPSVGGNCYNEWTCTGWSECTSENIQKRTCSYIGTCNVHEDKPKETQDCIYISSEPEKNIIKLEPVFDMLLEIPTIYKDISVEDDLVVIMKLTDIKLSGKSDIIINFKIIDEDNNILLERSETIAVENKANLLREFELPENTKDGLYQLEATLFYGNNYELKVVGSDTFNVKRVVVVNYNLIIIVLFSVIGTIIYIAFKQRKIKYIFMKGIKNSIIDKKIRRKLEIKPKKS
ncbi:MAG: hypothetical protein ABIH55_03115, partial [Nanoarchaeota archaeon]|nr:hypothetical protein [Nanoarchaeota archaeon]